MAELIRKFRTLVDIGNHAVATYPDRDALGIRKGDGFEWMKYRDFGVMVDETRAGLAALGLQKGDRVAVVANNCIEWANTAFAAYGLGGVWVPMYESQKQDERVFIMQDCQPTILCVRTREIAEASAALIGGDVASLKHIIVFQTDGKPLPKGAVSLDDLRASGRNKPVATADIGPDDLAGLIYTSGTTGLPKGVQLSHGNLADNVNGLNQVFPTDPAGETSLAFLPWAHVFGQTCELYGGISLGGRAAVIETPATLLEDLPKVRPTILFSVPMVWNRVYTGLHRKMNEKGGLAKKLFDRALVVGGKRLELAAQGKSSLLLDLQYKLFDKLVFSKVRVALGGRLKYAVSGGAALSPEVGRFLAIIGITVSEGYGLTETSPIATYNPVSAPRIGTVGVPLPGISIRIEPVDSATRQGEGEIIVLGHNVMKGYYNREQENAAVFTADGGLRTGDMGWVDPEGYLRITGRVKEQYKLENGKYVVPAPLEEQLRLSPIINQTFVHGANAAYNVALIIPDFTALPSWAKSQGLADRSPAEWCESPELQKAIKAELEQYSKAFKGYEKIRRFKLIAEEMTVDNGMLTPKMSIKRRVVMEKYGDVLTGLYAEG